MNSTWCDSLLGLAQAAPLPTGLEKGLGVFRLLASRCGSFDEIGRAMAWVFLNFSRLESERAVSATLRQMVLGKPCINHAMHRGLSYRSRPLFPLPLGAVTKVQEVAQLAALEDFCRPHFAGLQTDEVWTAVALVGLNGMAGFGRAPLPRRATEPQVRAVETLRSRVAVALPADLALDRSLAEAEKELASRYMSYTGEEVPKMQVLSLNAAEAALPPATHGGSIDARELLCEGTKWFLEHPEESELKELGSDVKLQAKVHIKKDEALDFCKLLVDRRICVWIADADVFRFNNQQVLNGLFAVGKNSFLSSGEEIQRTIMNLVPTNACFKQAQGATSDLPSICQYLSLTLNHDQGVQFYQSDMSAAFYLFRIPPCWSCRMAFNVAFKAQDLGLSGEGWYRPACAVIPMGWSSAVSIMQEIADRLTTLAKLPQTHQIRRRTPLPSWMTDVLAGVESLGRPWYHIYLDNFCAMQRVFRDGQPDEGRSFHEALEATWAKAGVLSSEKKRISGAPSAQELGALLDGDAGQIGPSEERLLKLIQSTLMVLSKNKLKHKWVQVIAGRWIHCMSFRRPSMVLLDAVWDYVSGKKTGPTIEAKVRGELLGCCTLGLLLTTNLRAGLSPTTTASDASSTGGAVGRSDQLTEAGQQFTAADLGGKSAGLSVPILVLSLFNGVGCAYRCYDLCGVQPLVGISYELNKAANRIVSRRWPYVQLEGDVRSLTIEVIRSWRYKYPEVQEVHVWGGFPCVGLSSVRAGRLNLDDPQSGLFWELTRIIKDIRGVYGFRFPIFYVAENVASMDATAEADISRALGTKPLRFDPCDLVPQHRPRFCWTNVELQPMDHVYLEEKERWVSVTMEGDYPTLEQWLEPGAWWPGYEKGKILPTSMKSIRRAKPPLSPAGLDRVDYNAQLRWIADEHRFPPYQYHEDFLIWVGSRWRLINAQERELLHGLGYDHTALAWSAGDIKRDPQGFEDVRKSLATQADRRRARRDIVLEDVGVTKATLERYHLAVSRLCPVLECVNSEFQLDEMISEWVQSEFEDGCPLHLVGDALSGLHHFEPFTRKKLQKSWRLYNIWRRYEVPARAPPITPDICLAMAGWAILHDELVMGALLLLGFHCLMRTGELLQIRPCDFLLDSSGGLVSIPSSKSGVRNNTRESVTIHDSSTLETVRAMLELRHQQGFPNTPCWDRSGSAFRSLFRRILGELEISELNLRPYSLRRGGATYEMQTHGLMERTLIRGRWKNSNVARLYICDGLSMIPRLRMTFSAKHLIAKFSSMFLNEHHAYRDGKRGKRQRR
eukprot:s2720_g10.t1